ncbi:MAG: helix-turn-helix transcriptional regulator [Pyrinomonadaceae bacterium]
MNLTGAQLRRIRKQAGRTQVEAAAKLGVSQTYLSLLEKGERPVTLAVTKRATRVFGLDPTTIPWGKDVMKLRSTTNEKLFLDLAALHYPGFSYMKPGRPKSPVEVLAGALSTDSLEPRLVEALPWVVLKYSDLDWNVLILTAKVRDFQNRLGFVVNVARRVAEMAGDQKTAALLQRKESTLDGSRLVREDTLCNNSMTEPEKRWLRESAPSEAKHWRLLTDLSPNLVRNDY